MDTNALKTIAPSTLNDDLPYWLALAMVNGVGPITIKRLISIYQTPERIFQLTERELIEAEIGSARAKAIKDFDEWKAVDDEMRRIREGNIQIITLNDLSYPQNLKEIDDPPPFLYMKGQLMESDKFALAIVGSRDCKPYGIMVAEKMTSVLVSYGLTIVSGMAKGVDTVAHKAALQANGRTIAVLGCGIDVIYPRDKDGVGLYHAIQKNGAIVTEYPMGAQPLAKHFPRRNRIISGLSLGVLVVEAAVKSGSLSTAHHAVNQGKEVFAVPGNIYRIQSKGTNNLIKKGAKLVDDPDEIISELSPVLKGYLNEGKTLIQGVLPFDSPPKKYGENNPEFSNLTDQEKALIIILDKEPKHIDNIMRESKISISTLMGLLLSLELKGIVRQWEGKLFSLS
jgi:DNA processing protein